MTEDQHSEDLTLDGDEAEVVSGGMQVPNPGAGDIVRNAVNTVVHSGIGAPVKPVKIEHPGPVAG